MHPDILRELGSQRNGEMRARARRVKLARMARKELRTGHGAEHVAKIIVPDFVDGSFVANAAEEAADRKPRRILAGRHAA